MIEEQLRRPAVTPPVYDYTEHPPPPSEPAASGPSLGRLFSDLSNDFSDLVREEIRLARVETMEKVSTATRGIVSLVAGGLVAYAGLLALLVMVGLLLNNIMPAWLASAIVGIIALVIGLILISAGRSTLSNMTIVPEKTIKTLKDDAEWVKEQVK
jgi:uncharacterized membrane protein YqjE